MKLLYKPFGIVAGILGGLLARRLFTVVWGAIDDREPPSTVRVRERSTTCSASGQASASLTAPDTQFTPDSDLSQTRFW